METVNGGFSLKGFFTGVGGGGLLTALGCGLAGIAAGPAGIIAFGAALATGTVVGAVT